MAYLKETGRLLDIPKNQYICPAGIPIRWAAHSSPVRAVPFRNTCRWGDMGQSKATCLSPMQNILNSPNERNQFLMRLAIP